MKNKDFPLPLLLHLSAKVFHPLVSEYNQARIRDNTLKAHTATAFLRQTKEKLQEKTLLFSGKHLTVFRYVYKVLSSRFFKTFNEERGGAMVCNM